MHCCTLPLTLPQACALCNHLASPGDATPRSCSTTPYHLYREAAATLLILASGSRSNQRLLLRHEAPETAAGGAQEGMAQCLFGRLLKTCGDYATQVVGLSSNFVRGLGLQRTCGDAAHQGRFVFGLPPQLLSNNVCTRTRPG